MALTPNDVLNKQFQTTKFRDGYDQDEVDDFLDEVLAEFQRLSAENERLKAQLASTGSAAPAPDSGEADSLRAQLQDAQAQSTQLGQQLAEARQALQTAQQQAAAGSAALDGMSSAEYLQLARRVHEEHVREGVAKRDEAIEEGQTKAAQLLADAQARHDELVDQAESIVAQVTSDAQAKADALISDARAKADALLAEAQTQHDTRLIALAQEVERLGTQRDALQKGVDGLQEFERSYRASLKTYLETQLGELQATSGEPAAETTGSVPEAAEAFPTVTSQPPFDAPGAGGSATPSPFDAVPADDFGTPPAEPAGFEVPSVPADESQEHETGEPDRSESKATGEATVPPAPGFGDD